MTPMRIWLLMVRSPLPLIRAGLDLTLIGTWIWLASDNLPQPIPAFGAALFGAASAAYWALQNRERGLTRTAEDEEPRDVQLGRLTKFAGRPARGAVSSGAEWFSEPQIERRMQLEADRCKGLSVPMAVIFIRTRPSSLAEMADSTLAGDLSEVLPRLLDGSRQSHLTNENGREAVITWAGGDRIAAGELLHELRNRLEPWECEAGVVVYPDEGVDASALVSLARLRLQRLKDSSVRKETTRPAHFQNDQGLAAARTTAQERSDHPETAVS